jgi:PAS domain S-box-containing protein
MIDSDAINATIDRAQHTLLVVDDNPATRYSTSRILKAAGFRTIEAGSGAEALAQAASGVSGVVLDVHLPDINGFEVCRHLRHQDATATIPIVHLSAEFTRDEDRVAGLDSGADAYLVHPVEPAVLVATLQALVRARTAEVRLRGSESRFRAIYDHAASGILVLDEMGLVSDANPAMVSMLGYPRDELVGRELTSLTYDEWRQTVQQHLTASRAGAPWQGQFPLQNAQGSPVHLEWSVSPPVETGHRIAIAIDASARIQLEQKRRDVLEREQAARAAAEKHSRTKDDFIAVLSHELRTPLNAIVGWVAILMRRNPTPEAVRGLEAIDRNVKSQARIISDILDVSRINSGKLRLEREFVDPAAVIENAVASLRPSMEHKRLKLHLDLEHAREPAWVDPERFQQIFWNLMTNAIKFSRDDGEIRVTLARNGPRLALAVQDFGQGIHPDFIGRLFDRFSQSNAPGNRSHGGLGLGLSIVRHLVELHGGTVRALSAGEGQGALIQVELYVEMATGDDPEDTQPADLEAHEALGARPLEGLDVLVVEDDTDANEILSVVLADRGATVRIAVDYDSAVAALRTQWPDVLISDIGLPVRDGYELIRKVRDMQPAGQERLPAIALTAFSRSEDKARALNAGFDDHVAKPLNPHTLVASIHKVVVAATRH